MITTELEPASIPRDLDLMPPGPRLAAVLSTIEVDRLSGRAAILFARAQNRQISHDQARQYQALSRVGELYMESSTDVDLWEFASVEIGAALTQSRRTAAFEMGLADDIVNRYPTLFTSLLEGRFDLAQVRAIVRGVGHVDREVANRAIDLLLPEAAGLTSGQISARLRRLVIEADPEAARQAYEDGIAAAKVWSQVDPDGTATMIATGMEPHRLSAANRNINRLARARKNGGDPRPIDKIRADVFVELLTGEIATSSAQRGEVKVTGDLTTLTRLDDRPGFLEGYGPVIADIVRQIALQQQNSRWTFEISGPADRRGLRRNDITSTHDHAETTAGGSIRDLCPPGVPDAGQPVRFRPHQRSRSGRVDHPLQSRPTMSVSSPQQTSDCVDVPQAARRNHRMAQSLRAAIRHPPALAEQTSPSSEDRLPQPDDPLHQPPPQIQDHQHDHQLERERCLEVILFLSIGHRSPRFLVTK